jgi:hypothetical protein
MGRSRRLTPNMLRTMVLKEKNRMMRETSDPIEAGISDPEKVSAEEVDADEQADTLAKDIDHIKALKIEERKLYQRLVRINEAKKRIKKRLLKKL